VPYWIAAGLGEGGRNGGLLAPFLGNRHRICKVYTDFEFVEYDKPRTFGYSDFCMNCKLCAEACPSEAITFEDKPTWGPTYEGAEDPNNSWNNNPGILKFHNDAKKCFKFWTENNSGCTNCITSCVYNKPDVWHHVFIDGLSHVSPGWVHGIMRDLDHVFGYGTTFDEQKVKNFWVSGKNMRGGKSA
jgi:ferredoxin